MIAEPSEAPLAQPSPHALPKWEIGGSDFVIFLALLFSAMGFCSFLFTKLANWILAPSPDEDPPLLAALAGNLGMQLGMLVAFLGFRKGIAHQDRTPPQAGPPTHSQAITIGLKWLLIAYPVMIAVNFLSREALNLLGFEQVIQDPIRMVQAGGTSLEISLMYAMIVLVAPVCEETVFRGGIFRFLHHRFPLYASIGVSAFLFALLHLNLYSFAPLMTIGVMLAFAYRESGSLLSNITFHAAFNSINLALILLFPELT